MKANSRIFYYKAGVLAVVVGLAAIIAFFVLHDADTAPTPPIAKVTPTPPSEAPKIPAAPSFADVSLTPAPPLPSSPDKGGDTYVPKTLEEQRKYLIEESQQKNAIELADAIGHGWLSDAFMPSLRKILMKGYAGTLIGEIGGDPRVQRILEEGKRWRTEDPKAFAELIQSLQQHMEIYGGAKTINGITLLSNDAGAHAWPYLLGKLDPSAENLQILLDAGDRIKNTIDQDFKDFTTAVTNLSEEERNGLRVNYSGAARTFTGYGAYLCLEHLLADEANTQNLNEEQRAALAEYEAYETRFQEAFGSNMADLRNVTEAPNEADLDLDSREALASQLSLYGKIVPPNFASRTDGIYQRSDFILDFAARIFGNSNSTVQ